MITKQKFSRQDRTFEEFLNEQPKKTHCVYLGKNGDNPSLDLKSIASTFKEGFVIGFSGEATGSIKTELGLPKSDAKSFICIDDALGSKKVTSYGNSYTI